MKNNKLIYFSQPFNFVRKFSQIILFVKISAKQKQNLVKALWEAFTGH